MVWIFDPQNIKFLKSVRKTYGNVSVSYLMRKYKLDWNEALETREKLKRTLKLSD